MAKHFLNVEFSLFELTSKIKSSDVVTKKKKSMDISAVNIAPSNLRCEEVHIAF